MPSVIKGGGGPNCGLRATAGGRGSGAGVGGWYRLSNVCRCDPFVGEKELKVDWVGERAVYGGS